MMRNTPPPNGRRRRRQPPNQNTVRVVRAVHRSDRARDWTPPIVMPKAADVIPATVTLGLDFVTTATSATTIIRLEDLIGRVRAILESTATDVRMRVLQYSVYGNVTSSADGFTPSFAIQHADPLTLTQGLTIQVRGTLVEPARTAHSLSEAN